MFKIVNLALIYYYLNAIVLVVFPYIVLSSLIKKDSTKIFNGIFHYVILMVPIVLIFSIATTKYSLIFSLYLMMFYFGSYFFYVYFRQRQLNINIKSILVFLAIMTILESLAINTIIFPSDLPNWPLTMEKTLYHGVTSRGSVIINNFFYIRPVGFGGNSSITASLLMCLLFYLNREKNDSFIVNTLVILSVILLYTGTGYITLFFYIIFFMRSKLMTVFLLVVIFMLIQNRDLQKLDVGYYFQVIMDSYENLGYVLDNFKLHELFFGEVILEEKPIGGDFYWLYFFQWFGIIGISFYAFFFVMNINKITFFPILLLVIATLHYHVIFSIPGQMILGYLLSRKSIKKLKDQN